MATTMPSLFGAPAAAWPWIGITSLGLAAALTLNRRARLGAPWCAVAVLPLGIVLYALALIPLFALLPTGAGAVAAAGVGLAALALCVGQLGTGRGQRATGNAEAKTGSVEPGSVRVTLGHWPAAVALATAALVIGGAAARFAQAVLFAAPIPAALGEPSTGDWGLHALRVAMLVRYGVPPPSPLDPDYPLQYRYLFHSLAAAFLATTPSHAADPATIAGATSGLVVAALVLAAGTVVWLLVRAPLAALCGGLLAGLYGPSYWLPEAARHALAGRWPGWADLSADMGTRWALSPLTPSFPSVLSAQGSSPGLPLSALCWFVALLSCGALMAPSPASPASAATNRSVAALTGVAFAALIFAADFFAPLALAGLALALLARPRVGWVSAGRVRADGLHRPPLALRPAAPAGAAIAGCIATLVLLFGATHEIGAAGAARDVRLTFNARWGVTPVYGGNHALLAGGQAVPWPNWVQVHDWGILFWPGVLAALAAGLARRNTLLLAATLPCLFSALFWHIFTISYVAGTPSDLRVQMYRYAGLATAIGAPLFPAGLAALWKGHVPAAAVVRWIGVGLCTAIGGLAGLYFVYGAWHLTTQTRPEWRGDAALARVLAQEPRGGRLAVLGGPASFVAMYNAPGAYLPLWWALGQTSVPVGWDFGHPEWYEPLYRRVVADMDAAAAAELHLTHVAFAPAHIAPGQQPRVRAFLRQCAAQPVAAWGNPQEADARALYRISAGACAGGARATGDAGIDGR